MSTPATITVDNGNSSRGHAVLLSSEVFESRLCDAPFTELAKNVQARSPVKAKSEYGTPPVSMSATRSANTTNTRRSDTGAASAQTKPRVACL